MIFYKFHADFVPREPLYSKYHTNQVYISDVGIFLWLASVSYFTYVAGFLNMMKIYGVPYLWVNQSVCVFDPRMALPNFAQLAGFDYISPAHRP